jgi:hypothetical protein
VVRKLEVLLHWLEENGGVGAAAYNSSAVDLFSFFWAELNTDTVTLHARRNIPACTKPTKKMISSLARRAWHYSLTPQRMPTWGGTARDRSVHSLVT